MMPAMSPPKKSLQTISSEPSPLCGFQGLSRQSRCSSIRCPWEAGPVAVAEAVREDVVVHDVGRPVRDLEVGQVNRVPVAPNLLRRAGIQVDLAQAIVALLVAPIDHLVVVLVDIPGAADG